MRRAVIALFSLFVLVLPSGSVAQAHCEVPCGIYGDQMRFEMMLEDQSTILKAMNKVVEQCGNSDPLAKNQHVRWINTKESSAQSIQDIIARYFMAQRIKAPASAGDATAMADYVSRLTKAHRVMQLAMKCKQTVDAAQAKALHAAIKAFHAAYVGKKKAQPKPPSVR